MQRLPSCTPPAVQPPKMHMLPGAACMLPGAARMLPGAAAHLVAEDAGDAARPQSCMYVLRMRRQHFKGCATEGQLDARLRVLQQSTAVVSTVPRCCQKGWAAGGDGVGWDAARHGCCCRLIMPPLIRLICHTRCRGLLVRVRTACAASMTVLNSPGW